MIIKFIIKTILNRKFYFYNYLIMPCYISKNGKKCTIMSGGSGTYTMYDENWSVTNDSSKGWH